MEIIDYKASDFEKSAESAVQSKEEFAVKVSGWRRRIIASGLRRYRNYRENQKRTRNALMLIPYGFITPTFWVVCVKAEFEHFMPNWQTENGELIINFIKGLSKRDQ
jgi:hypothetical protein